MSEQPEPDLTIHPETGEKIVLKSLLDFREKGDISPMTKEKSEFFLQLFSSEHADEQENKLTPFDRVNLANNRHASIIEKVCGGFGFRVFAARMHPETQITIEAFLLLLDMCKGPGDAVLWCYTLHRLYQKEKQLITISSLANEWPWGFPNESARQRCWDDQKGRNRGVKNVDNLIDRAQFWA
jgi:hypothetical protein